MAMIMRGKCNHIWIYFKSQRPYCKYCGDDLNIRVRKYNTVTDDALTEEERRLSKLLDDWYRFSDLGVNWKHASLPSFKTRVRFSQVAPK